MVAYGSEPFAKSARPAGVLLNGSTHVSCSQASATFRWTHAPLIECSQWRHAGAAGGGRCFKHSGQLTSGQLVLTASLLRAPPALGGFDLVRWVRLACHEGVY